MPNPHDWTAADEIMQEAVALLIEATKRRVAELRARPMGIAGRHGIDPDRYNLTSSPDYRVFLQKADIVSIRARWVAAIKTERAAKGMDPALDVDSYFPDELAVADARSQLRGR